MRAHFTQVCVFYSMSKPGNNEDELMRDDFFDGGGNDSAPANIFSKEFMDKVIEAKKNQPSSFASYWEEDEEDIETWSKVSRMLPDFRVYF